MWLLLHGAPLHGTALHGTDQLALIIEPAKAGDLVPLIIEAYGLTPRELDVTRAIARGLGTADSRHPPPAAAPLLAPSPVELREKSHRIGGFVLAVRAGGFAP